MYYYYINGVLFKTSISNPYLRLVSDLIVDDNFKVTKSRFEIVPSDVLIQLKNPKGILYLFELFDYFGIDSGTNSVSLLFDIIEEGRLRCL